MKLIYKTVAILFISLAIIVLSIHIIVSSNQPSDALSLYGISNSRTISDSIIVAYLSHDSPKKYLVQDTIWLNSLYESLRDIKIRKVGSYSSITYDSVLYTVLLGLRKADGTFTEYGEPAFDLGKGYIYMNGYYYYIVSGADAFKQVLLDLTAGNENS